MTVWCDEAAQLRAASSCSAEVWGLVSLAGGLAPVASPVGVASLAPGVNGQAQERQGCKN